MRTIPGFAAEASLYKGREHYYAAQGRAIGGDVLPAQFDIPAPNGGPLPGEPLPDLLPWPHGGFYFCYYFCYWDCQRVCLPWGPCFPICRRVCRYVCV